MTIASRAQGKTPLDELRWLLDQSENRIGALETGTAADTLRLLHMLDEVETIYNDLAAADVDLRAEETRRETMQLTIQRKAGVALRLLRPQGGIAAVRSAQNPPASHWWWYLDVYVAQQRRKALRELATTAVVLVAIVAVAALLYHLFLRPDPLLIARMNHVSKVQRAMEGDDLNGALQAVDEGVAEFPNDGELLIWRGAILVRLNRQQEAQVAFAAARPTFANEPDYLVNRSQIRLQAQDIDGADADARAAIALAPDSAQAYLMLGGAQEVRGQISAATQSYSTAASLAAAKKDTQLEAMAKVRMAMMLQAAPMFPAATPQPTPTR